MTAQLLRRKKFLEDVSQDFPPRKGTVHPNLPPLYR